MLAYARALFRRRLFWVGVALHLIAIATYFSWTHIFFENPDLGGIPLQTRLKGLESPDERVQIQTLRTLAAFGPDARGGRHAFMRLLGDSKLGPYAAVALGRLGPAILPDLLEILAEKSTPANEARKRDAVRALGYVGPEALPELKTQLTGPPELRSSAQFALTQLAAEHPDLIPEIAALIHIDVRFNLNWKQLAKEDPRIIAGWKKLLDDPDPALRRRGTVAILDLQAESDSTGKIKPFADADPRMIDILLTMDSLPYSQAVLLQLHAAGHSLIPVLRKLLTDPSSLKQPSDNNFSLPNRLYAIRQLLEQLGTAGDRLLHDVEAFVANPEPQLRDFALGVFNDVEKRRAKSEFAWAVTGAAVSAPPRGSAFPDFFREMSSRNPDENWSLSDWLQGHLPRNAPELALALEEGNSSLRLQLLKVLSVTLRGLANAQDRNEEKVIPEFWGPGLKKCLEDPETRGATISFLAGQKNSARPWLARIFWYLDETNLESMAHAIREIGGFDPRSAGDFAEARRRFDAHPRKAAIEKAWNKMEPADPEAGYWVGNKLMLRFTFWPKPDDGAVWQKIIKEREKQKVGYSGVEYDFIRSLIAVAPDLATVFPESLGDALESLQRANAWTPAWLPVLQDILEKDENWRWRALFGITAICRKETPQRIADALHRRLAAPNLNEDATTAILETLAGIAAPPKPAALPERVLTSKNPRWPGLIACIRFRADPKDAAAKKIVLEQAVAFSRNGPVPLSECVGMLSALPPNDPELAAVLARLYGSLEKYNYRYQADRALLKERLIAAGGAGTRVLLQDLVRVAPRTPEHRDAANAVSYYAIQSLLHELHAENRIRLPELYLLATISEAPKSAVLALVTEETAPRAVTEYAKFGVLEDWIIEVNSNRGMTMLRWNSTRELFLKMLTGADASKSQFAYRVLAAHDPTMPELWPSAVAEFVKFGTGCSEGTRRVMWYAGEKALPIYEARIDSITDQWRLGQASDELAMLLSSFSIEATDRYLVRTERHYRLAAIRSLKYGSNRAIRPTGEAIATRLWPILNDATIDYDVRDEAWKVLTNALGWSKAIPKIPTQYREVWLARAESWYRKSRPDELVYRGYELEAVAEYVALDPDPRLRALGTRLRNHIPPAAAPVRPDERPVNPPVLKTPKFADLVKEYLSQQHTALGDWGVPDGFWRLLRFQREQILLKAKADPKLARELALVHFTTLSEFQGRDFLPLVEEVADSLFSELPGLIDELAKPDVKPLALRSLVRFCGRYGEQASLLGEKLLPFAGDSDPLLRKAAREAIRSVNPKLAVELR